MALVKYGGGVSSMSGKLGGTVAARNRAGAYLRNWAFPTNTPSASQTLRRTQFALQSAAWSALSDADRNDWNTYAAGLTKYNRQGDAYTPPGRQIFISLNNNLTLIGEGNITSPPFGGVPPTINSFVNLSVVASGSTLNRVRVLDASTGAGNVLQFWGSPQQTTGKTNLTLLYRYTGYQNESTVNDYTAEYILLFPNLCTAGASWYCKIRMVDPLTGLTSPFQILKTTAV